MSENYSYPVFLNISGRQCVVVGGGKVAVRKVSDLLEAGAEVTVVAENHDPQMEELARTGDIILFKRPFEPEDVYGAMIVFAATDNDSINAEIAEIARKHGALVNVVDNPEHCDFFSGAVIERGPLRIAVSTSGRCPAIAATIRRELEELYSKSYGDYIETAGEIRRYILTSTDITEDKKNDALKWLGRKETFIQFIDSGKEEIWKELQKIISC